MLEQDILGGWENSIDNNLKSQPQHFWKYVSNFRKHRSGSVQLNIDGTHLAEPTAVADAFAKYFQSIHNNCSSIDFPRLSQCFEFLSVALFLMWMSAKPSRD
jgi:hypothetical protein